MEDLVVFKMREVGMIDELDLVIGTDTPSLWPYLQRFADAVNDAYNDLDSDAPTAIVRLFVRTRHNVNFDTILAIDVSDHCEWVSEILRNFLDVERIIREEMDLPHANIGLEMKAHRNFYPENPFEMENGW